MEHSIDARIVALAKAIERRKMEQEAPVDDLSRSLFNLCQELAGLDALGKSAMLHKLNHSDLLEGTMGLSLSMGDLDRFMADYAEV